MITAITTGFLIGLVGSFHCIGMCGPIAIALPVNGTRGWKFFIGRILYNVGRITTYAALGTMMGVIGQRFFVAGFQQEISVAVGGAMIVSAVAPRLMNRFLGKFSIAQTITRGLKTIFSSAFRKRTVASLFVIGVVNGFLPCGLVYMAMAGSATMGSIALGAVFMAGFGVGTLPVMLGVSVAGSLVSASARHRMSRLAPVFIVLLGVIILLRGLNLGIPMVSPKISAPAAAVSAAPCCG
jgi:uncharacterized protein